MSSRATIEAVAEHRQRFDQQLAEVSDPAAWDAVRVEWLGRKRGLVRDLLSAIGKVDADQRSQYGQAVNALRQHVEASLEELQRRLEESAAGSSVQNLDVTLPGRAIRSGAVHPVHRVIEEIVDIFRSLGYSVAEGPEIEDDYHNFAALNFPADHPARDEQDTLFTRDGRLLRTHTSPVQVRTLASRKPPIRIVCPGRTYRNDNDLRHSPMFHQVECLAVAEGITLGDLKGTLEYFVKQLFTKDTRMRLRPSYFPFTEPSAEVDITCPFCQGSGCRTCSESGWMEILGSGMVDPRVLAAQGIDPDRYSGFAYGLGADRVAMIRYGVPNIRQLFEGDVRLLRQVTS